MQYCGQMPFCTVFNSREAMEEAKKNLVMNHSICDMRSLYHHHSLPSIIIITAEMAMKEAKKNLVLSISSMICNLSTITIHHQVSLSLLLRSIPSFSSTSLISFTILAFHLLINHTAGKLPCCGRGRALGRDS